MKVGIDARLYFESGVGRYIRNTLIELDKYCLKKKSDDKFYVFLSKKGFEKINFKSGSLIKVEADFSWHSLREQLGFPKLLYSYNLDVMHFTYFSLPVFYKKKFIVTIHDLIINFLRTGKATTLPRPLYELKRLGYHKVMNHAVNKSKFIISPSESTKKEIINTYKLDNKKIVVIPEGIDPNFMEKRVKPKDEISEKFILYVGNAYPHKNLDRLIEAFASVQNRIDEDLILVGKSDFFYKKLYNKTRNNSRIKILHNINDNELSYLYDEASFLVAPSFMEGFGLTPLEAMAHSCLPVVSSIDAFRQVCENAALYFNPEDIQDIASALLKGASLSIEDKNEYKKLFKKRLALFSWGKSFEKTLKIYERCYSL
jgi:glycosyltransferase involved in cell wall biosynthesis